MVFFLITRRDCGLLLSLDLFVSVATDLSVADVLGDKKHAFYGLSTGVPSLTSEGTAPRIY